MEVGDVIRRFDELQGKELSAAVKFITGNPALVKTILLGLRAQSQGDISQQLFEWLYKCVQLKTSNNELLYFCLQFIPELVVLYMHSVYEDVVQLKRLAETLLIAYLSEVTQGMSQSQLQVPTLSRSSIYHQSPSQLSQPVLTEAVLQRHNEVEIMPKLSPFVGTTITVNNRFQFLCSAFEIVSDHIMLFNADAKVSFCQSCIRLCLQGMGFLGLTLDPFRAVLAEYSQDIAAMKRISITDGFFMSLLRGIRVCLFQSSHAVASLALQAVKLRAEYELLTDSLQTCHTLSRLVEGVQPQELTLDVQHYSSYHGAGDATFMGKPADIHSTLNSLILHHNLPKTDPPSPGMQDTVLGKSTAV